jgi:hypothetical protein
MSEVSQPFPRPESGSNPYQPHPPPPQGAPGGYPRPDAVWPGATNLPPVNLPPARKRHVGLAIALSVVGTLILLCGVGGLLVARPILREYPATMTTPDQIAGLTKLTDPQLQRTADQMTAQFQADAKVDSSVVAFYAPAGDKTHLVMVGGGTKLNLRPGKDIDDALRGMGRGMGSALADIHAVPAGPLGGYVKCGSGTVHAAAVDMPVVGCVWADHGSLGMAFFFNRQVAESEKLFGQIREVVLQRG